MYFQDHREKHLKNPKKSVNALTFICQNGKKITNTDNKRKRNSVIDHGGYLQHLLATK